MSARTVLYVLLLVVAGAAAVSSFAALRDLAVVCGFAPWLAWLLPVVVDAGAAAGSLAWLGSWPARSARRFGRVLALTLIGLSVTANALGHGLAAFAVAPPWWVVVVVSAVAPAVLGAVVHLAVLVGRPHDSTPTPVPEDHDDQHGQDGVDCAVVDGELLDERGVSRYWDHAPPAVPVDRPDRAAELIAAGAGRRRLSRELEISEYEARQLLERTRTTGTGMTDAGTDGAETDPTDTAGAGTNDAGTNSAQMTGGVLDGAYARTGTGDNS